MAEKKSPKKKNISQMEKRRAAIKEELERIEAELEDSLDDIKEDMTSRFEPKYWINKYPFESLGASVLLGFILGNMGSGKSKSRESDHLIKDSLLWSELKRALTRKAVQRIMDMIDSKLDDE